MKKLVYSVLLMAAVGAFSHVAFASEEAAAALSQKTVASPAKPKKVDIAITPQGIRPSHLTIPVGTTVSVVNRSSVPYRIVLSKKGSAAGSSKELEVGTSINYTFDASGDFNIQVDRDSGVILSGTIQVVPPGTITITGNLSSTDEV